MGVEGEKGSCKETHGRGMHAGWMGSRLFCSTPTRKTPTAFTCAQNLAVAYMTMWEFNNERTGLPFCLLLEEDARKSLPCDECND